MAGEQHLAQVVVADRAYRFAWTVLAAVVAALAAVGAVLTLSPLTLLALAGAGAVTGACVHDPLMSRWTTVAGPVVAWASCGVRRVVG